MRTSAWPIIAVFCSCLWTNLVSGQHHHHSHEHRVIHNDHVIYDRHGHRVVDHHDYHYIVPSRSQNYGTFYTYEDTRYYTPAPRQNSQLTYRPTAVEFGSLSHVDELATRLVEQCNQFCLDLYHNYRHNVGYKQTYREAYQILTKAKYVHDSEHAGDQAAIRQVVQEMDGLLHHVQEDVSPWTPHIHRHVGYGNALDKLSELEAMLHHLMYDVGVQPAHDAPLGSPTSTDPAGGTPPTFITAPMNP